MESAKGCQTAPTKEGGKKVESRSKKVMQLLAALLLLAAMFVARLLMAAVLATISYFQKAIKEATDKAAINKEKKEEK